MSPSQRSLELVCNLSRSQSDQSIIHLRLTDGLSLPNSPNSASSFVILRVRLPILTAPVRLASLLLHSQIMSDGLRPCPLFHTTHPAASNTDGPSSLWLKLGRSSLLMTLPSPRPKKDHSYQTDQMYYSTRIIASVIGVAGAGFRLSLILNAVGHEMATADLEIQKIAKEISLFSLILKQVGRTMEAAESLVSQSALDSAKEITFQSQTIFNEVKEMVEMSQQRDANGNLQSITIAQRVRWCFKKQRVRYLLGQLESLKLSLSIMLQILLLGKTIATTR